MYRRRRVEINENLRSILRGERDQKRENVESNEIKREMIEISERSR